MPIVKLPDGCIDPQIYPRILGRSVVVTPEGVVIESLTPTQREALVAAGCKVDDGAKPAPKTKGSD